MIDVIVDQGRLGAFDSLLHGLHLLRDDQAIAAAIDHVDDAAKMALGAFEALADLGVAGVEHGLNLSPGRGYGKKKKTAGAGRKAYRR